ncbi:protein transport protein SEC24 [Nematocida sp. AWRm80]|nr:protein transport protein SEC24 [Nematocida sp. AWRm80]
MFSQPHDKDVYRDESINKGVGPLLSKVGKSMEQEKRSDVFDRLPAIPTILEEDIGKRVEERLCPPYSTTHKFEWGTGDLSSAFIRSSLYTIPADEDLFELVGLPFLVVLQPFNDKVAIPEYRQSYLSRCTGCGSFPVPSSDVYQFKCVICGLTNDVAADFPSLREPLVDYILENGATKEVGWYTGNDLPKGEIPLPSCRKWKEPCVVFVIDTSIVSKNTLGYSTFLDTMRNILISNELALFYRRVGIVLLGENTTVVSDSELGYVTNVLHSLEETPSICAPLLIETANLTENRIDSLMALISDHTSATVNIKGGIVSVIQLVSYTGGGKVLSWLGGSGYDPLSEKMHRSAIDCGVCLNIFSGKANNLEGICNLAYATGGTIDRDINEQAVVEWVLKDSFFRCSTRMVCSDGIKKRAIYSAGSSENITSVSFSEMSATTTLAISLSVEEFLKEGTHVYIQSTVEYIDLAGNPRIRVFNLKLKASRLVQQVFAALSFDTLFCGICKYICSEPANMTEKIRKAEQAMIMALTLYKRACAKDTSSQHLVLPDTIKALPVLIQSVLKFPKVHLGLQTRIEMAGEIMPLSIERTLRMFYPRLIRISSLFTVSTIDTLIGERLSMKVLDENDSYLLDNGSKVILWFGRGAVDVLDEMIQCETVQQSVDKLREIYGIPLKITHCIQGELDAEFIGYMIEDQMGGYPKYQEYLGALHQRISKK